MKPRQIYLLLCVLGLVLPYWQFVPWVSSHGLNLSLFLSQLFANRISTFFGMDVFVSAAVLIYFIRIESGRQPVAHRWVAVIATALVGVSLGLPLFLYLREDGLEARAGRAAA
jgi:hypothetical protein